MESRSDLALSRRFDMAVVLVVVAHEEELK